MTPRYGIDTSILVRLLTGEPVADFEKTVSRLKSLLQKEPGAALFASNQVIGEAYIVLQHHYRVTKLAARQALLSVLESGLVAPLHGSDVLDILRVETGCGLMDRLIANDYSAKNITTLTHDRKMAHLPGARLL